MSKPKNTRPRSEGDAKSKGAKGAAAGRILDTASKLFYRDGIAATGVDTVVEQAGVAKMTLYSNYGDKDGLIAAYLQDRDDRWRASLVEVTDGFEDATERLLAIFEAYGEWLVSDGLRGCGFVNASIEIADPDHPARAIAREHKQGVLDHLATQAAEAGASNPKELAEQLLILLEGAAVMAMVRRSAEPLATARGVGARLVADSAALRPRAARARPAR